MVSHHLSRKAQSPVISSVVMILVVTALVILTFTWGNEMLETQQVSVTVTYSQAKLLDIKNAILEVAQEQINSTRIVRMNLRMGSLSVLNGSHCSGTNVNKNAILYNLTHNRKLIDSLDWVSIDPVEPNFRCSANQTNGSSGVLVARPFKAGNSYANSFMIWFRQINDTTSSTSYLINISIGEVSRISGTSTTIIARNIGRVNSSGTIHTNVLVDLR
jgi:flagellin-like protein